MITKRAATGAVTNDQQQPNYGGYYLNAHRLAKSRAQAVIAFIVSVVVATAGAYAASDLGEWWPAIIGFLVWLVFFVYGTALWTYTTKVSHELWKVEQMTGIDIDGDGVIGNPVTRTRYIDIAGELVPFVEETDEDPQAAVIIDLVPGFELPPAVIIGFVEQAAQRGLGRRQLVTAPRLMAADTPISKGLWERIVDEMAGRKWIAGGGNGTGYTWVYQPESIINALRNLK
jgi:hypothetical protein